MGAIAEALAAYAQPLIDQTDGSHEQLQKALTLSQLCYNLALLPEKDRDSSLDEMRRSLDMDDKEFDAFRQSLIAPMILRHQQMFPRMHQRVAARTSQTSASSWDQSKTAETAATHAVTDRYAPCPCGSGEKYKFCCGKKRR